ncbi:hypothetical protein G6F61_014746 [Rhizopus arrhizus]|nr:hypothetical protein G6F61_014746 [Rhizopus arrhizus]
MLERHGRKRQRYANTQRMRPMQPRRLRGLPAAVAALRGWIPGVMGCIAPAAYLIYETYKRLHLRHHCDPAVRTDRGLGRPHHARSGRQRAPGRRPGA